jgi:multiple sugar transport system permease protein
VAVAASPPRRAARRRRRFAEHLVGWGFAGPASLVVLGLAFFPIVWQLVLSTRRSNGFGPEQSVGLANYRQLARSGEVTAAVWRSLEFAALYVPLTIALGLALALALNQKVRGIGFYRTCYFVPFVASAAATGVIFNYLLDPQYGIVNGLMQLVGLPRQQFLEDPDQALYLLVPVAMWGAVGFDVLTYLAALQDVPQAQIEAARIDGAGRWQVVRHVVMPTLRPITVLLVVWETINALQLFDLAWTTTRGGPVDATTVIVVLAYKLAFVAGQVGLGAATAAVLFAVIAVLTLAQVLYGRWRKLDVF